MTKTAAALIVGDEILSGKIQEANLSYLGQELFSLGVLLKRAVICGDDIDVIASDLNALRTAHDIVFTSGGVGPTHDDVTLVAVAKAFDVPLESAPEIEALIRGYHKERVTDEHLRMALVPRGARLLRSDAVPWPTVVVGNVFVFPGVPQIFRMKFPVLREELRGERSFHSRAVFTHCDEGSIARLLAELAEKYAQVRIGSYPRFRDPDYKVKVTFDGTDKRALQAVVDEFVAAIGPEQLVRVE